MVFTARRSYASAVLGVVILSVCPSVRLSHACFVANQMWFFLQLCSSWQDFNWLKASRGPSAIAELLVISWWRGTASMMLRSCKDFGSWCYKLEILVLNVRFCYMYNVMQKNEPFFFCAHLWNTWQKLVNFYTYIKEIVSYTAMYWILAWVKNIA